MAKPTVTDSSLDEYNQGLRYCPFIIKLDRLIESFNIFDDLSSRIYVRNKK